MKIFFDTTPLMNGHQGRGIGVYTKNLVTALKKIPTIGVSFGAESQGGYECDVIHYPYFDFFFHTLPIIKKTKTVVTIHDVNPLIFKKEIPPGLRGETKWFLQRAALRSVSAIITDSQNSKADIQTYLHINPQKIFITPLAVDASFKSLIQKPFKARKKLNLPEKYLLYVGDININKNIVALIKAFNQVTSDGDLVIVSRALKASAIKESKAIIQEVSHSPKKGKIHLLTEIEKDNLPSVYHWAESYVQPSLYEGFGLPLLEAFESKIPVLSSNTSSLPEVGGSAPIYFNPSSLESITMALEKGLTLEVSQRESMIKQGLLQAEKFSWNETAKLTVAVYKKVIGTST